MAVRKQMKDQLLIVADSERDANMLYAVGMFVPDAFIYLKTGKRPVLVMSDLELDRARREAPHCQVISRSDLVRRLQQDGQRPADTAGLIAHLLRREGVRRVCVPENFPLGIAQRLQALRIRVKPRVGDFFAEREYKSAAEVKKISAALTMAEVGLAEGIHAIKNSRVGRNRRLMYRNAPLTAEKVRGIIGTAIIQAGGVAANTIVACGPQTSDPHERGHGILRAGEPIILDVFPRSQQTGYFGDITRTVVKGRAPERLRQLYRAVEEGQDLAFSLVRHGASARAIHAKVQEHFNSLGYKTCRSRGRMQGFFHSTGHGLGLDLHETLSIGPNSRDRLQEGHVVTIEPGLYFPNIGGVRLEDVALVTKRGARNLTRFEKVLEV